MYFGGRHSILLIAFRLKIAESLSSFHVTLATLGHKYLLDLKPCHGTASSQRNRTEEWHPSKTNGQPTCYPAPFQDPHLNSKQFLIHFFCFGLLIFHWWVWEITPGNMRHFGLIVCDCQTDCWFPLLSVWIWVSVSRGPYKTTLKNLTFKKGQRHYADQNWPNSELNTEGAGVMC